jgi:hypothetical protein
LDIPDDFFVTTEVELVWGRTESSVEEREEYLAPGCEIFLYFHQLRDKKGTGKLGRIFCRGNA